MQPVPIGNTTPTVVSQPRAIELPPTYQESEGLLGVVRVTEAPKLCVNTKCLLSSIGLSTANLSFAAMTAIVGYAISPLGIIYTAGVAVSCVALGVGEACVIAGHVRKD